MKIAYFSYMIYYFNLIGNLIFYLNFIIIIVLVISQEINKGKPTRIFFTKL